MYILTLSGIVCLSANIKYRIADTGPLLSWLDKSFYSQRHDKAGTKFSQKKPSAASSSRPFALSSKSPSSCATSSADVNPSSSATSSQDVSRSEVGLRSSYHGPVEAGDAVYDVGVDGTVGGV